VRWLRRHGRLRPLTPSVVYWGHGEIPFGATLLGDGLVLLPPTRDIDVVCTAPPGPGRECVLVEIERAGRSVDAGVWVQRPDGLWALRIREAA
jgi:hypothetical protein